MPPRTLYVSATDDPQIILYLRWNGEETISFFLNLNRPIPACHVTQANSGLTQAYSGELRRDTGLLRRAPALTQAYSDELRRDTGILWRDTGLLQQTPA